MAEQIYKIKQQMCEIGQRIWQRGYCAGNEGNHSVRIDANRVLTTPTGISKGMLTPEMICLVDMEGKQIDTNNKYKRTSEVLVHLAIYKKRPDVKAVIHSHPPHATAFAIAQIPLPEGIHPEAEVFLGRVPTAPYATPSKQDLPDSIIPLIGAQTNTVLMGNHGSVSFSHSLMDTYYKLEILDAYCRILILTKQLGHANVLNPQQMTELLEVKKKFGLPDDRLKCSPAGCVGEAAQPFLATFEARPATAVCHCDGGKVEASSTTSTLTDAAFEAMVQTITDQIMTSAH
ncbi:MAG: class II aldolase/adducin family protein [Planctomycetes bacterium]|nr:class II aldolase/adducin family protein [Planctomycetota bacterium]